MGVTFRVNGGCSAEGDCVVCYGDLEFWLPWRAGVPAARSIERECAQIAAKEQRT